MSLSPPDLAAGTAAAEEIAPRLAELFAEALERPAVGRDQDAFALGADSLGALHLLARVEEVFGVQVSFEELYDAPTVARLAEVVARRVREARVTAAAPAPQDPPAAAAPPLSFAQRRLWFLDQLAPGNPVHNIAAAVRIGGPLAVAVLARVFGEIVRRHEPLRTGFAEAGSGGQEPVQAVLPPAAPRLPLIDLAALPAARRERQARAAARRLARRPFDLRRGRVLRLALLRLTPAAAADGAGAPGAVHDLVLALHHIAADGGSLAVLAAELGALYAAFAAGRPSPLPELPMPYGAYARRQRRRATAAALAPGLAWWRERLGGGLPPLELPADRPRPAVPSYRGAHHERLLGGGAPRLAAAVAALARGERATAFMVFLAGFLALVQRHTGETDLVVGTPVAGRDRVELEPMIGLFLNNLVLRTSGSGAPGLCTLLGRVRETVVGAFAHHEVPFELLADELQPGRDLSRAPLFQVMFVGQNAPLGPIDAVGLRLVPREIDLGTARFDLAVAVAPAAPGSWLGTWKYSTDLFDAATVARLAAHLDALLAAALGEPDRPLEQLPLLSAAECHQLLAEWNDTAIARPAATCLHHLIVAQAERAPDAVAVVYGAAHLSAAGLLWHAGGLAARLLRLGVGAESRVGIATERSLEMMIGLLGTLLAGAAYVPLDPDHPPARLAYVAEDAGLDALLCEERLRPRLGALCERLLAAGKVVALAPGAADGRGQAAAGWAAAGSPAYAIYTSGSTGQPKGAIIPHEGIVNRLLWMQERYGLGSSDRLLQKTPIGFDVSVWELFWPLFTGASLVVAPPRAHQDPARLTEVIRDEQVTTLHFVPSMLQVYLDQPGAGAACRSVRQVFASGEALSRELVERFGERLPGAALHNLYGPTEASVDVTFHACRAGGARVPIGRPIANTAIVLLDRRLLPVPIGVPGELHIGGAGLARGYLGRPALTAERFIPDPRARAAAGARLYRTGDLARCRPDGEIEFLGRLDHQVKVRGVRVELGEIEAALARHPALREAVAVAAGGRLAAYVVPAGAAAAVPAADDLRAFLRRSLPEAMVPGVFVTLASLPLTPSGKVDRKALLAPEAAAAGALAGTGAGDDDGAPRTPLEARLAALWGEQLGATGVGIHDSFFALGGDSIQGALLINRLQRELGAVLYVMALFDHPTVAGFAAHLAASYAGALVAAGWQEPAPRPASGNAPGLPEAAREETDLAALAAHLRTRFSAPEGGGAPAAAAKNRRAVFLLSPFRSGSTLLRVMLAGHPRLFAPPELELLGFTTLGERRRLSSGRDSFAREGLLRAVMELVRCDVEAAAAMIAAAEDADLPTPAFYRRLQELAGDRLLVDKTPRYALDAATLERAEAWFEEPLYIHLVRHPAATIRSYLEARMDEVYRFPLPPRRQAELVWRRAHQNVLDFLAGIPERRWLRLRFEDLVSDPHAAALELCRFLSVPFDPAVLSPYDGERMTDGVHRAGRMMGDPKFHSHQRIDAAVADSWRAGQEAVELGEASWQLAGRLGYAPPRRLPPLAPAPRRGRLPLAHAQERLWFVERLAGGRTLYAMPGALRLRGAVRPAALAATLAEIVRRHESLRTRFVEVEGRPEQVIDAVWRPRLPQIDLAALPSGAGERELWRLMVGGEQPPLDLARGPLLHASLVRLAADDHVLLVTLHHLVADGWSVGLLLRELTALYPAMAAGLPSPLPELPVQYADFAVWQRQWLRGAVLEEQLEYWRRQLQDLAALELPADRVAAAGEGRTFRAGTVEVAADADLGVRLHGLASRHGASLFMVLLALYQTLLHRHSGQADVTVGAPIANRGRAEVEPLIGLFVNTLALRTRPVGGTFAELLARVRGTTLAAYEHQDVPFAMVVDAVRPGRREARPAVAAGGGGAPLFDVMLTLQNQPAARAELPGLELTPLPRAEMSATGTQFSLVLTLRETGGRIAGTLGYNAERFAAATAARWGGHLLRLAEAAAADPAQPVDALPLLGPGERHQLLHEWGPEVVAQGEGLAGIGVWGELRLAAASGHAAAGAPGMGGEAAGADRRARRLASGALEWAAPAPVAAPPEISAAETSPLASRRDNLSAIKRELLKRRLSGQMATIGAAAAGHGVRPAAAAGTGAAGRSSAAGGPASQAPAAPAPGMAGPAPSAAGPALVPDLASEAVLDPAIAAGPVAAARTGEPEAVLLTGATGFLGPFLVAELLRAGRGRVVCLVRAESAGAALARLRAGLEQHGLWEPAAAARLEALPGDLSRPLLGLMPRTFDALAARLGAIFHNGAWVNASYPYQALKAANVLGTEEVLRLAFRAGGRPLHFVSTISVFFAPEYQRRAGLREDDALLYAGGPGSGYSQSKWVAEKLVEEARQRGLAASIYRFGRAAWDSRTGTWNQRDALRHVIETCLALGSAPEVEVDLDLIPVDYVARAIVALAARQSANFHLLSPQELTWGRLVDWLRELGHPLARQPFAEWMQAAQGSAGPAALPHLQKLRDLASPDAGAGGAAPRGFNARFDSSNSRAGLAGSGIVCPELTPESLRAFLARLAAPRREAAL